MRKKETKKDWPFDNGGFLSGRQLFDILLLKKREDLERFMTDESTGDVTLEILKTMYRDFLRGNILGLSEQEKSFLSEYEKKEEGRTGILSSIIGSTDWRILIGSCCRSEGYFGVEASVDGKVYKKLDFLRPKDDEETQRIIRLLTIQETGREITGLNPEIVSDEFRAVRPYAGEWGLRMIGRKGRMNEKHML